MIQTTLQHTLINGLADVNHLFRLYEIGERETIFYVGQSFDPATRLEEHVSSWDRDSASPIGKLIIEFLPESLNWTITLYTLEDCLPFVQEQVPSSFSWYQEHYHDLLWQADAMTIAEQALIMTRRPCLNRKNNLEPTPLPKNYQRPRILNEGLPLKRKPVLLDQVKGENSPYGSEKQLNLPILSPASEKQKPLLQASEGALQVVLDQGMSQEAVTSGQQTLSASLGADKSVYTRKRQRGDLARFCVYLDHVSLPPDYPLIDERGQPLDLGAEISLPLWGTVTSDLVRGFRSWLFDQGYALETIKGSLSTIKTYCDLAVKAGLLAPDEASRIRMVKIPRGNQTDAQGQPLESHRKGHKKAKETLLSEEERERLLGVPDLTTPQGWRDLLLLLLLYDLGLRPGELVAARLADLDLGQGLLLLHRGSAKSEEQWLALPHDTWEVAKRYVEHRRDCRPESPLLVSTRKNKQFVELVEQRQVDGRLLQITPGMSVRKLSERVHTLGLSIGVNITADDARHQWVNDMVDLDNSSVQMLVAGGWTKESAILLKYRGHKRVANHGLQLKRKAFSIELKHQHDEAEEQT